MNKVILKIGGMSCSACSSSLEKHLNKEDGIINATVNLVTSQAVIEYDNTLSLEMIENFIQEAGFESLGIYDEKGEQKLQESSKYPLIGLSILAILIIYISMSSMIKLPTISVFDQTNHPVRYAILLCILTIPYLIYGKDIIRNGIKNFIKKKPNMDSLVTIGVMTNFLYSIALMILTIIHQGNITYPLYFESCIIIILFVKIGRYIDKKSKEKAKKAIQELVQITPKKALLKLEDRKKEVNIDEIRVGDILLSPPGSKIAVDGIIIDGKAHIDEAFITGESIPCKKTKEDKVVAGSINLDGFLEYKAEKVGKNSTISEIVRLVIEAVNTKVPIASLADKISNYFVPTIIFIAIGSFFLNLLLTFSLKVAITSFITVLVIACPCALGLATPLALSVSIGKNIKDGILIKNSSIMEEANKIDTVIFDKTGTLTYGKLKIAKIHNYSKYTDYKLIGLAASLETKSSHPISHAFDDYIKVRKIDLYPVENFITIPGVGLSAIINGKDYYVGNRKLFQELNIENPYLEDEEKLLAVDNSIVYIIENNEVIGLVGASDMIREEAEAVVKDLKALNKEIILLTGDNEKIAKRIAENIGIQKVKANLLPKEKKTYVDELIKEEKKVMMIGDGINDAPSLASATIGVSVYQATDISTDSSDVILLHNNLKPILSFFKNSKKSLRIIKENLFWAFFYNLFMIPIAMGVLTPIGISINPIMAAAAMTCSSLTVVWNSLRLKK